MHVIVSLGRLGKTVNESSLSTHACTLTVGVNQFGLLPGREYTVGRKGGCAHASLHAFCTHLCILFVLYLLVFNSGCSAHDV